MEQILLNIGCGERKFEGFVNIDLNDGADLQIDVTNGIPFPDNSVTGIYCEHFIEHLTQSEGIRFLRECRRVLVPNGTVRIATPDLDYIVQQYQGNWKDQAWIGTFGYAWIDNRCEVLNIAMREWGHKWMFNQEELVRLGTLAGLTFSNRCAVGKSEEPFLNGLEWREDSSLIIEFKKNKSKDMQEEPLVSILIPAYNADYFKACLESAINQTYSNLEIIICDDGPDEKISSIVQTIAADDKRVQYYKNEKRLTSVGNYIKCYSKARGDYIKFLNDDDLLHPACVERMLECLKQYPEASLVTSHRKCIDSFGNSLGDPAVTKRPVTEDSFINGSSAVDYMLGQCLNFIGEPTTAMFRRNDLIENKPNLLSFAGRAYTYNVDVVMWVNLLSKGDLIYLYDTLSYFRLHDKQEQRQPGGVEKGNLAWHNLRHDGARMGLLDLQKPKTLMICPMRLRQPQNDHTDLWGTDSDRQNLSAIEHSFPSTRKEQDCRDFAIKTSPSAIDQSINEIMKKGRSLFASGDLKSASDCFRSVLDIDERNVEAIKSLGIIAYSARMLDSATFFFEQAGKIDPSDNSVKEYIYKCKQDDLSNILR